jgi:hypothetical protein
MADYTQQTWVDETGVGDGTLYTAARMTAMEAGIKDAAEHHKTGLDSAKPVATAANKNWRYFATDTGIEYQSDGTTWVQLAQRSTTDLTITGSGKTALALTSTTLPTGLTIGGDANASLYRYAASVMRIDGTLALGRQSPSLAFMGDIDTAKWITKLGGFAFTFSSDSGNTATLGSGDTTYDSRTYRPKVAFGGDGSVSLAGAAVIAGAFQHKGTTFGAYNKTPVSQPVRPTTINEIITNVLVALGLSA